MSWACLLRSSIKILCSSLCLSRSLIQLLSFSAMSLMLHQLGPGTRSTTCPYDSPTILGTLLPESHHHDQSAHRLPADKCDMQLHVVLNQQLGHRQRFGQRSSNLLQLVAPNRDVPQLVSRSIHGDRLAVNSRGSSRVHMPDPRESHPEIADDSQIWIQIGCVHQRLIRVEIFSWHGALNGCD